MRSSTTEMADIPWHPNTHVCFGVDGIVGAFLLGAQRLTAIGAAPPMDPAVLEEMLAYIGVFKAVVLSDGIVASHIALLSSMDPECTTIKPITDPTFILTINCISKPNTIAELLILIYSQSGLRHGLPMVRWILYNIREGLNRFRIELPLKQDKAARIIQLMGVNKIYPFEGKAYLSLAPDHEKFTLPKRMFIGVEAGYGYRCHVQIHTLTDYLPAAD